MGASVIATPERGTPVPSATSDVVRVVGHLYHMLQSAQDLDEVGNSDIWTGNDWNLVFAWPLVVPFAGTFDQVSIRADFANLTRGSFRLALYHSDEDTGQPDTSGGGFIAEGVFPLPAVINVAEVVSFPISLNAAGGRVIWAFFTRDQSGPDVAPGNLKVWSYTATGTGDKIPGWGFGVTPAQFAAAGGTGITKWLGAGFAGRADGGAFGPIPPNPTTGVGFTPENNGSFHRLPMLAFRLAAL